MGKPHDLALKLIKTFHLKQGNITIPLTFMLHIVASLAYQPYQKKAVDIKSIKKKR